MPERIAHPCAHPECPNPGTRLIWWREGTTAGRTWACNDHVAELRQERVDAGCTVMGGEPVAEAVMRFCATCSTVWAGHDSASFGGVYRCPACRARHMVGFDPQPNHVVRFIDGPQHEYVVLARDGKDVTVRRQGFPECPALTVSVRTLRPGPGGAEHAVHHA